MILSKLGIKPTWVMDGESNTNLHIGRRLPMIGRHLPPRGRVESLGPGVRARAVNLEACGPQKARVASRAAAITGKVSTRRML